MNMRRGQRIRPSQFILTYGPGSILEGQSGPRVILDASIGLFGNNPELKPRAYSIGNDRMLKGLLNGNKIYRLPTSSELPRGVKYLTRPFPEWKLCVRNHGPDNDYLLYIGERCPDCDGPYAGEEAIRFVLACRQGHLDDVPWDHKVHRGSKCKNDSSNYGVRSGTAFYWHRTGGTLWHIIVRCIHCEMERNLGEMYRMAHKCTGRHPQNEIKGQRRVQNSCDQDAKIIARQSASLHVTETRTLLQIEPNDECLYRLLSRDDVTSAIVALEAVGQEIDESVFRRMIKGLADKGRMPKSTESCLSSIEWDVVRGALDFVKKPAPDTYGDLIREEFSELVKASVNGAPPQTSKDGYWKGSSNKMSKTIFEVDPNCIDPSVVTHRGYRFRITPIQKLTTVTVQIGFRREIPGGDVENPSKIVRVSFPSDDDGTRWYPGVEYTGEGIFLRLEDDAGWMATPRGDASAPWLAELGHQARHKYPSQVFRSEEQWDELHPGFVWWHTLSHLLIRIIGQESGYSSASIRERVYFQHEGGRCRGGILLYATQPGSEGTMGGLIGMREHMQEILNRAFETCATCSGDPLCAENRFQSGGYNGASCYACLLNSETSCEHRNMWLDRNVLNGD